MRDHLVFSPERLSAFCAECGKHTDQPHTVGVDAEIKIYCEAHCPECNAKPPAERTEAVITLAGEQGGLF